MTAPPDSSVSRIVLVEDDVRLRALTEQYLTTQGFAVRAVGSGAHLDRVLLREYADLVVLDLMLPGEGGLSICQRLRQANNALPILILTAKGDENERIRGLEIGADDYLPKPFNPRELVARIRAVLRRRPRLHPAAVDMAAEPVVFGNLVFDAAHRQLRRGDEPLELTSGEFNLLHTLVDHAGEPMARDRLLTLTRGREWAPADRSVDILVSRLRRLIEPNPAHPRYIQTVWGLGYVFVREPEAGPA